MAIWVFKRLSLHPVRFRRLPAVMQLSQLTYDHVQVLKTGQFPEFDVCEPERQVLS